MRRIAVSKVFVDKERCYSPAILELYEERVANYYPVEDDDMPPTEWVGGVVILSGMEPDELPQDLRAEALQQALHESEGYPFRAYHLKSSVYNQGSFTASDLLLLTDED